MIDTGALYGKLISTIEGMESEEFTVLLSNLAAVTPDYLRAHMEMEHSTPSPSGVTACRLQQYLKKTDEEVTSKIPASWSLRAAAGTIGEPLWLALLRMADVNVSFPEEGGYPCGPLMRAHPDGLIDQDGLLELKSTTGWTYKRLIEGIGVAYEEPKHYMQAQLYMYATGRDWCLYLASTPDPALLQSMMRNYKKYGKEYELPFCYLEVIKRREQDIEAGLARAEMIVADRESGILPPRDFDGRKNWPCNYCPYQVKCQETYG